MDLVLVEIGGKNWVFEAPYCCRLEKGDKVICNTKNGEKQGEVVSRAFGPDDDVLDLIARMANVKPPFAKIKGKMVIKEFVYEEESEGKE